MENDQESTSRSDETLPTNDEQPSLDRDMDDMPDSALDLDAAPAKPSAAPAKEAVSAMDGGGAKDIASPRDTGGAKEPPAAPKEPMSAKTLPFPGPRAVNASERRLDESFGRPDIDMFPDLSASKPAPSFASAAPVRPAAPVAPAAPIAEAPPAVDVTPAAADIPDDAKAISALTPLDQGTGWEETGSIDKPISLRARIEIEEAAHDDAPEPLLEALVAELEAEAEAADSAPAPTLVFEPEEDKSAQSPRHEAIVTPFPGTILNRQPEPTPSEVLRSPSTSSEFFDDISAQVSSPQMGGVQAEAAEPPANQDALADAVQSALRNIYGGYNDQPDDSPDQGFTVADALAGSDMAGEEPVWSENRAQAAEWRGPRSAREFEEDDAEDRDFLVAQRRQERAPAEMRAPTEMSLSELAARGSMGEKWQSDPIVDEPRITPFPTRERPDVLRGRNPEFDSEPSIVRGGSAGMSNAGADAPGIGPYFHDDIRPAMGDMRSPMEDMRPAIEPQWSATPYAAPQNARGSITPTYVPATAAPSDQLPAQGPDSGHLLGAAGLGLIGGIALAGVLAVFVFNSFVDETGQNVNDPKVVERLSPAQTAATTTPSTLMPAAPAAQQPQPAPQPQEARVEEPAPPTQTAAAATAPVTPDFQSAAADDGKPKLTASAANGAPDTPIRLNIALLSGDVGDALVSLKGLPKEARLSTGIDVGGGQWLLPPARLKDLTVTAPSAAAGNYQLEAQLLKDDAQTSISDAVPFALNVGSGQARPAAPAQQPAPAAAPNAPRSESSRVALLPDEAPLPETDFLTQMLIRDGNKKMRDGDIAAARKLYEQAAASGNAEAALAMGRSYDPTYFEKLTVKTGKPDPATAFEWYKRALDGGLVTAKVKIDALKQWLQR